MPDWNTPKTCGECAEFIIEADPIGDDLYNCYGVCRQSLETANMGDPACPLFEEQESS